jgi:hypothetical protein
MMGWRRRHNCWRGAIRASAAIGTTTKSDAHCASLASKRLDELEAKDDRLFGRSDQYNRGAGDKSLSRIKQIAISPKAFASNLLADGTRARTMARKRPRKVVGCLYGYLVGV